MIRKNALFCKLIRIKTSSKSLFSSFMKSFIPETEPCPICLSRGNCRFHAYYERNIIDFANGKPGYSVITVTRVLCNSCGHTHAILPDFIVPYSTYGLFFLLRVLSEYFSGRFTIEHLCQLFAITPSMLYRWKALFLLHKELWLGILSDCEASSFSFLKNLFLQNAFSEFSSGFFLLSGHSFLQKHKNPTADSYRSPP
jgi:hypothetical protein